jgi:hypothetical protein
MSAMAFIRLVLVLILAMGCFDQYKLRRSSTLKRIASGASSVGLALVFAGWVLGLRPDRQIEAALIGLLLILFSNALQFWGDFVTPVGQGAEFLGKPCP